jgi:hypothetical protein
MLLLLTPPGSKERKGGKIRQLFSIKLQETRKQQTKMQFVSLTRHVSTVHDRGSWKLVPINLLKILSPQILRPK